MTFKPNKPKVSINDDYNIELHGSENKYSSGTIVITVEQCEAFLQQLVHAKQWATACRVYDKDEPAEVEPPPTIDETVERAR